MSIIPGQEIHVTMEMPSGDVISAQTMVVTMTVDHHGSSLVGDKQDVYEPGLWMIELAGIRPLTVISRQDFAESVSAERSASEWECDFCGAINSRERQQCQGCNAWRPFVYGAMT